MSINTPSEIISHDAITVLLFENSGKTFAVDVAACQDVNKNIHVTRVPHAPEHISGIVNIRGEIVTVFNLARMLEYQTESDDASVVIRIKGGQENVALHVDRLRDTVALPLNILEEATFHLSENETRVISHVALLERTTVLLIDPDVLRAFLSEV